ncbi:uncharacterized protein TNCV_1583831 [Trichonephila clavipes]|nr:uncharacterized protein TNCV_1583831 [Trichonephila clavipes]
MRIKKENESNRAIVTSEIISIAKEIGGEGFDDFGEHDIEELLVDEALNDDDILESMVDITKDLETVDSEPEEDVTPLDEKLLREGLQLSGLRAAGGWSNRRIGRHLGRSDMVVARCWQQWITEGRVYRRGGSGRPQEHK